MRVLMALSLHADRVGWCNPTLPTLASAAQIEVRHCREALIELSAKGWVTITGSKGIRNEYQLHMPPRTTGVQGDHALTSPAACTDKAVDLPRSETEVCTAAVQQTNQTNNLNKPNTTVGAPLSAENQDLVHAVISSVRGADYGFVSRLINAVSRDMIWQQLGYWAHRRKDHIRDHPGFFRTMCVIKAGPPSGSASPRTHSGTTGLRRLGDIVRR